MLSEAKHLYAWNLEDSTYPSLRAFVRMRGKQRARNPRIMKDSMPFDYFADARNDNRQNLFEIPNQAKSNPHINTRFVGIHERVAHLANLAT